MVKQGVFLTVTTLLAASVAHGAELDRVLVQQPYLYDYQPATYDTSEDLVGFIEGSIGYGRETTSGFDIDGASWSLRGSMNTQASRNMNFQVDGSYNRASVEIIDVDTLVGAAHAYYRQPDSFAVGAFVQGSRFSSLIKATDVIAGAEAAIYTDAASLYGQVGFGQTSLYGFSLNHLLARAGARLYATDDVRLDLEAGFNRLSASGITIDAYSLSATGNYRLSEYPVTAFAGYRYDHLDGMLLGTDLGSGQMHSIMTGLRFHFGSDSLKQEERYGPAWTPSLITL